MEANKMDKYLCYVFVDYDVIERKFLLEFYDFRNTYFDVKEFETVVELHYFVNTELLAFLQVKATDILFLNSNAYTRKIGLFDNCIENEYFSE